MGTDHSVRQRGAGGVTGLAEPHAAGRRAGPSAVLAVTGGRHPGLPAALVFASLVAATACGMTSADSQGEQSSAGAIVVPAGRTRAFSVTAYCTGTVTQSGARVKAGMAAADPRVLPVGSTVRVDGQGRAYDGIYTVTDTGREIKGRELDLYLDDCAEAEQFGRRTMRVAVIRRGWDPAATPGLPARSRGR